MADIHILGGSHRGAADQITKTAVFHFTINPIYRVAAASEDPDLVSFVSEVPNLATDDPAEVAAIKAGEVVERVVQVPLNFTQTPAERLALVREKYAALEPFVELDYRVRYYEYKSTYTST